MPTVGERVYSVRTVEGIDRQEDQRIDDPNALFTAQNIYARAANIPAKRPGSRCIINGRVVTPSSPSPTRIKVPNRVPQITAAQLTTGQSLTPLKASYVQPAYNNLDRKVTGVRGIKPVGLDSPFPAQNIPSTVLGGVPFPVLQDPVTRTAGLQRLYFDQGSTRLWVGAYNFGSHTIDRLFFVESDLSKTTLVNDTTGIVTSHGADFFFLPYRYVGTGSDTQSYYAIGTNQLNQPFVLKNGSTYGDSIELAILDATRASGYANGGTPSTAYERITHVQAMCVYAGSVVYAGYRTISPVDGTMVNKENFAAFSDSGVPHSIAENASIVSSIRVGDTEAEGLTACGTSVTTSDAAGVKGQLVLFTDRRVVVFDGLPPQTGSPLGADFSTVAAKDVGCVAPRTVVTTPFGLCFLGTDGFVYLIPAFTKSGPIRIGHKVWDIFRGMNPRTQRQCAAFWHPIGYYCLSYPETSVGSPKPGRGRGAGIFSIGSPALQNAIPNKQLWGDFREFDPSKRDANVKWYGPHTNMIQSCFALALGAEDNGEVYAGSAIDGSIYQVWLDGYTYDADPMDTNTMWANTQPYAVGATVRPTTAALNYQRWEAYTITTGISGGAEPAWPTNPAVGSLLADSGVIWIYRGNSAVKAIDTLLATGIMDGGDASIDKEITFLDLGVSTDRATTVVASVVTLGSFAGDEKTQTFTTPVAPPPASTLGSFILGTSVLTPPDKVQMLANRPFTRLIGRAWRAEIRETPSAAANVGYSDIEFGIKILPRRA